MTLKLRLRSQRLSPILEQPDCVGEHPWRSSPPRDTSLTQPSRAHSPLVAVLEDRGVQKRAFIDLQNAAVKKVVTAPDDMASMEELLRKHALGNVFGLRWILAHLGRAGVVLGKREAPRALDNEFIRRVLKYAQTHVLREFKHDARIPIERAHQLVGIVDEGPAYVEAGYENVYCLKEGGIYGATPGLVADPRPDG